MAPLVQRWLQWDRRGASRQRVTQLLEDGSSAQLRELLGSRLEFGAWGWRVVLLVVRGAGLMGLRLKLRSGPSCA